MLINLIINWNVNKEAFTIPGIDWPVRWYGICWALAFLGAHYFLNKIFKQEGRTDKQLDSLTIYMIVGTVLGARLGHCLFYDFDYYMKFPLDILKIHEGGLASHGGAIGIVLAMVFYCVKQKENWLWLFDRMVVVVPLSAALIRIGNLMNHEIVGKPSNLPWAFKFLKNDDDLDSLQTLDIPIPARHPAQLYEAIFGILLFVLLYWLWKTKRNNFGKGFMFGLFCVLMFTERFFDEFVKENQSAFENNLAINMGQILSLPFIIVGIIFIIRSYKIGKHKELTSTT
ncbi:MAG: prolipoprotein diacylglyceryl transferase [Bacteroidetes bacterium]|nr:prolipoprotein diacylglyceryl transferase [Bacteroidota bacterium]